MYFMMLSWVAVQYFIKFETLTESEKVQDEKRPGFSAMLRIVKPGILIGNRFAALRGCNEDLMVAQLNKKIAAEASKPQHFRRDYSIRMRARQQAKRTGIYRPDKPMSQKERLNRLVSEWCRDLPSRQSFGWWSLVC